MRIALLAAATTFASAALAATTTTVVDIPAASGGTQRFLHIRPDNPIATLVQLPGGDGVLGIQADGSMNTVTGQCNPIRRSASMLSDAGIAIAMVDATTQGSTRDYDDVLAVVNHLRARDDAPIWIVGGSASTASVENVARRLAGHVGAVFYSPQRPSSLAGNVRTPALVIYHSADPDQFAGSFYNALTGAAVRERRGLSGGTNQGCGFHLFNGIEGEFAGQVAAFVARHNVATRPPNYQGLWYGAPAGSEAGWGVNFTHQGNTLFATWFTYDAGGRGMWLVMPGAQTTNGWTFTGALYRTTGPAFGTVPFDPARVAATEVGSARLDFDGENDAVFRYTLDGITQVKAITRQAFGPRPDCAHGTAHGSPPNYQALWWGGEAESGWGVNVAHQGDVIFATWFTYDADGRALWLVMPDAARTGPGAYAGTLYRTTGPAFSTASWNAASVVATPVGSAAFLFSDAERGTFSYTVGSVSQSRAIVRQAFASPPTICR